MLNTDTRREVILMARKPTQRTAQVPRFGSAAIQPYLRGLLATLADIDFAFASDLETLAKGAANEMVKQQTLARLHERRRELRAPYLCQLATLE